MTRYASFPCLLLRHDHLSRRLAVSMLGAAELLSIFSKRVAMDSAGRRIKLHLPPFPHLIGSGSPVFSLDPPIRPVQLRVSAMTSIGSLDVLCNSCSLNSLPLVVGA